MRQKHRDSNEIRSKLNIAVTMMALAVIALATATYAWFTLSLSTNVKTMELNVTSGVNLQISTNDSNYGSSVDSGDVEAQINKKLADLKITPLTSEDGKLLYPRSGSAVNSTTSTYNGTQYLEFKLYFKGSGPMKVYLTEDASDNGSNDGTKIEAGSGSPANISKAIRVSFQPSGGTTKIYQFGKEGNTSLSAQFNGRTQNTFSDAKTGNSNSELFSLTSSKLKETVTVRIWMEGDDKYCADEMIGKIFRTQLRFEGQE